LKDERIEEAKDVYDKLLLTKEKMLLKSTAPEKEIVERFWLREVTENS